MKNEIVIPAIPMRFPEYKFDQPISRKENLMRAIRHEKPLWLPFHAHDTQYISSIGITDGLHYQDRNDVDWFGVAYEYSELQKTSTPHGEILNDISEWREKVIFPNLDEIDFEKERDLSGFVRSADKALTARVQTGMFERLHFLTGFETALISLLTEPEETRAFFYRVADYKLDLMTRLHKAYDLDYIMLHDDYGTEKDTFFSAGVFEDLIYGPLKRIVDGVHALGVPFMLHCCGKIERFFEYFVELGIDAVEIQPINDIKMLLDKYGDRITIRTLADSYVINDPAKTENELRSYARGVVDNYGAHKTKGSGIIINFVTGIPESSYIVLKEITDYSLNSYKAAGRAQNPDLN